jgi:hypothetical protein
MRTEICCSDGGRSSVHPILAVPVMRRMARKYPGIRFWIEVDGEVVR